MELGNYRARYGVITSYARDTRYWVASKYYNNMTNGALWITNRIMNKVYIRVRAFLLFPPPAPPPPPLIVLFLVPVSAVYLLPVIGFHYVHTRGCVYSRERRETKQWWGVAERDKRGIRRKRKRNTEEGEYRETFVESLSKVYQTDERNWSRTGHVYQKDNRAQFLASLLWSGFTPRSLFLLPFRRSFSVGRKPHRELARLRGKRLTW